jgi:hypothetical protein
MLVMVLFGLMTSIPNGSRAKCQFITVVFIFYLFLCPFNLFDHLESALFLWHCALEASLSHSSGSITVAGIILTLEHTRKTVALRQKFFFLAVVRQKHDGWGVCK